MVLNPFMNFLYNNIVKKLRAVKIRAKQKKEDKEFAEREKNKENSNVKDNAKESNSEENNQVKNSDDNSKE